MNKSREIRLCGECLHHSKQDACCQLTGETKRRRDAACSEFTDGKMDRKPERERAI